MVPFSHILWSSCWLGIATAAVAKARAFVQRHARATPGVQPPGAPRLAHAWRRLQLLRDTVNNAARECSSLLEETATADAPSTLAFAVRLNDLKVTSSTLVVEIVHQALLVCGVAGYRNGGPFSLGRELRDAYSAALMVNNDRITAANASMVMVFKDS
jgi:acyl-CoA dehydrogenase